MVDTLRTSLLPVAQNIRNLAGALVWDVRPTTIAITRRVWSGGRKGDGTAVDTVLTVLPPVRVRTPSEHEISSSGGRYEAEDVLVDCITPAFTGGGLTPAQLKPDGAQGTEIFCVLSGYITGNYAIESTCTALTFNWSMHLRRSRTTP